MAGFTDQITQLFLETAELDNRSALNWRSQEADKISSILLSSSSDNIRERIGGLGRSLALLVSAPSVFQRGFESLTVTKMVHPLLEELHSSIFLMGYLNNNTQMDERRLSSPHLPLSYQSKYLVNIG